MRGRIKFSFLLAIFLSAFVVQVKTVGASECMLVVDEDIPSPYMKGVPPDKSLRVESDISWALDEEKALWAHQNMSSLMNTDFISRGEGPVREIPCSDQTIIRTKFEDIDGQKLPLVDLLRRLKTEAAIVIKDGKIVGEVYQNGMRPWKRHQLNSVTKSLVSSLVGVLENEKLLNLEQLFSYAMPQLQGTAVGEGRLKDALDMTLGMEWPMGWRDPASLRIKAFMAAGFVERSADFKWRNTLELIASTKSQYKHGEIYRYKPADTEMLGWSVTSATGESWQRAMSSRIWSRLGAEHDASVVVNDRGHGFAAAGISATLRDLARFGMMLENNGYYNGAQIVPESWIREIITIDDNVRSIMQKAPKKSGYGKNVFYNNQFRVFDNDEGEFFGTGGLGQKLYINQKHNLVVVMFATNHKRAERDHQLHLIYQIRDHLAGL